MHMLHYIDELLIPHNYDASAPLFSFKHKSFGKLMRMHFSHF